MAMAEDMDSGLEKEREESIPYLRQFHSVPAKALNVSSRRMLSRYLNPRKMSIQNDRAQDWEGLAELCGYDYQDIENYKMRENPTEAVLSDWTKTCGSTIGLLCGFLEEMERWDILEDGDMSKYIGRDVENYMRRDDLKRLEMARNRQPGPVQVNEVTSEGAFNNMDIDEFKNITKNEVLTGEVEYFDGFVCYTYNDFMWVKQMMKMLEEIHGLKLCIIGRDLMPGTAKYTVIAKLIEDRCKKMIIILSPDYTKSEECDFQTKFAHSLSPGSRDKKLVPVLIRPCRDIPNILRFITLVDYTKCDLVEWFWERLACSLKEPVPQSKYTNIDYLQKENKMLQFTELSESEINMEIPKSFLSGPPKAPVTMDRLRPQLMERSLSSGDSGVASNSSSLSSSLQEDSTDDELRKRVTDQRSSSTQHSVDLSRVSTNMQSTMISGLQLSRHGNSSRDDLAAYPRQQQSGASWSTGDSQAKPMSEEQWEVINLPKKAGKKRGFFKHF